MVKMKIETKLKRQGRICYKEGEEVGLWFEIKCLKENIADKSARGKDCKFEKGLLKSFSGFTEAQYSEEFHS